MATNRDQELVNGQKGVVNGSVAGTVIAVKQFPSLEDGFFIHPYMVQQLRCREGILAGHHVFMLPYMVVHRRACIGCPFINFHIATAGGHSIFL